VPTRYRASSSTTARLAADSSRRAAPEAAAVGGGGGVARQAETRARRDDGASRAPEPEPAPETATGATARKDWSEFMADRIGRGVLRRVGIIITGVCLAGCV
jgi:hypothetical protein